MNTIPLIPAAARSAPVNEVKAENISPRALIAPTKIFIKKTFPVIVFIPIKYSLKLPSLLYKSPLQIM